MTEITTWKQAAATLRKALNMAASETGVRFGDGYAFHLQGLQFDVRTTKSGVNVTINDRGYVRRVAEDGDPRKFSKEQRDKVVAEVEQLRAHLFTRVLPDGAADSGPALAGKTQWGVIFISARVTGVTHITGGQAAS